MGTTNKRSIGKIILPNEFALQLYSNALKNWNVKQGVSERSVVKPM
ncbi:MAG: hypothetical protein ACJBCI_00005 [Candidatus Tisiphia sp.]